MAYRTIWYSDDALYLVFLQLTDQLRAIYVHIGTLRAIGMSRWALMKLFLMEASLLGLVSGFLGVLTSWSTIHILNYLEIDIPSRAIQSILLSDTLTFSISVSHCLFIALAFSLFSGFTAILPALKGARLQPVTAIQRND